MAQGGRIGCNHIRGTQLGVMEDHLSACRLDAAHDAMTCGRFATATFANECQCLTGSNVEGNPIDRFRVTHHATHKPADNWEMLLEILYFQNRRLRSCNHSLTRFSSGV